MLPYTGHFDTIFEMEFQKLKTVAKGDYLFKFKAEVGQRIAFIRHVFLILHALNYSVTYETETKETVCHD